MSGPVIVTDELVGDDVDVRLHAGVDDDGGFMPSLPVGPGVVLATRVSARA